MFSDALVYCSSIVAPFDEGPVQHPAMKEIADSGGVAWRAAEAGWSTAAPVATVRTATSEDTWRIRALGLRVRTAAARTGEPTSFADGDAEDMRAVTGYRAERGPVLEKSDRAEPSSAPSGSRSIGAAWNRSDIG